MFIRLEDKRDIAKIGCAGSVASTKPSHFQQDEARHPGGPNPRAIQQFRKARNIRMRDLHIDSLNANIFVIDPAPMPTLPTPGCAPYLE
jgi:hypothetical protein